MLLEESVISEELVDKMRNWKHSGFSVYSAQPIEACDDNGRKTLSEYISRAPFSLERMSFNEGSDTVLYRGEHFHPTPCEELRCFRSSGVDSSRNIPYPPSASLPVALNSLHRFSFPASQYLQNFKKNIIRTGFWNSRMFK